LLLSGVFNARVKGLYSFTASESVSYQLVNDASTSPFSLPRSHVLS
jgi:hypothetical protein